MTILNQCASCGEDFASVAAFDEHILSAASDPDFDCMQVLQMKAKGWTQNQRGRWSSPKLVKKAAKMRETFAERGL